MSIKQGVRQRCVASLHSFAMHTEMIMITLEDKGGFRKCGRVINKLRYADATVLLAETEHELQQLMDIVVHESEQKGLLLNRARSYTMVFSKSSSIPSCPLKVQGKRIGIAKTAFTSMKNVL